MPIYLVKRTDDADHDETASVVVEATNPAHAREVAKGATGDQPATVWNDAKVTHLGSTGAHVKHGTILHTDYNAG